MAGRVPQKSFSYAQSFGFNTIINIYLNREGRKVFAVFINFKSAFPSVNHNLLWFKLNKTDIDSKYITIIQTVYSAPKIEIKSDKKV